MIDIDSPKGKLINAALTLAKVQPWREITLLDIAASAGVTLADVRAQFGSKSALLQGFVRAIDDEVLRKTAGRQPGDGPRDAIFEVVMARFDALAPHKAALRSIVKTGDPDPAMLRPLLNSQYWMLQAAGVEATGAPGAIRTFGLAAVYASVFQIWLDDDDVGMARTMAALDRRLRRGESNLKALDDACGLARRVTSGVAELFTGRGRRRAADGAAETTAATAPDHPSQPSATPL